MCDFAGAFCEEFYGNIGAEIPFFLRSKTIPFMPDRDINRFAKRKFQLSSAISNRDFLYATVAFVNFYPIFPG